MKSILEKALVSLLNEDHEKARELMHQFVVERAREIHESIRESDDEMLDDELVEGDEEFFSEADLVELDDEEAAENLADDLDSEDTDLADAELPVEGEADVEAEMDFDVDAEGEVEGDLEHKIDDIEDEIAALQAEFEKIMAEFEDMSGESEEAEVSDEVVDVADEDEDYDDVTESIVDELKKISVSNEDGIGSDGKKLVAKVSVPASKTKADNVGHTGFDREKAPATASAKPVVNTRKKATDDTAKVSATGPKGAELSKPVAITTDSPISGKKAK